MNITQRNALKLIWGLQPFEMYRKNIRVKIREKQRNEMYWHSEVSFHLTANIFKEHGALSVINNSVFIFFTSYIQFWSYTAIWKILFRITYTKLPRRKHYEIIWQLRSWITNVCAQQQIKMREKGVIKFSIFPQGLDVNFNSLMSCFIKDY